MNPQVKEKWIAALRSGKYIQGTKLAKQKSIHGGFEYCCLGVLGELYAEEKQCIVNLETTYPPDEVYEWAELPTNGGFNSWQDVVIPESFREDGKLGTKLSVENDYGTSFLGIANLIETYL